MTEIQCIVKSDVKPQSIKQTNKKDGTKKMLLNCDNTKKLIRLIQFEIKFCRIWYRSHKTT